MTDIDSDAQIKALAARMSLHRLETEQRFLLYKGVRSACKMLIYVMVNAPADGFDGHPVTSAVRILTEWLAQHEDYARPEHEGAKE